MDEKTKFTALDAFSCKLSAAKIGYISSPLTEAMKSHLESPSSRFQKRSAMMHRGYYARVKSQEQTIEHFMKATSSCSHGRQVVFLGSGYDPLGLEIVQKHRNSLRIFEVDFPDVISKKASVYRKVPAIHKLLADLAEENGFFMAPALPSSSSMRSPMDQERPVFENLGAVQLIGCDMRDIGSLRSMLSASGCLFSPHSPTLFITECVLVYLSSDQSSALISLFSEVLDPSTPALWMSYDMVHPEDTYGQMMRRNLRQAGFLLPGFESCPTPEAQCERFLSHSGWTEAHSQDMLFIYQNILDEVDKDRVSHLEIMDEVEEWNMLMAHYTLTIAARIPLQTNDDASQANDQYTTEYASFLELTRAMMTYDPAQHPRVRLVQFPSRK